MTEFQKAILKAVKSAPMQQMSRWEIAQTAFPEKWKRRQGRGALIGHIDRAASKMEELGRLPPKDRWGDATLFVKRKYR